MNGDKPASHAIVSFLGTGRPGRGYSRIAYRPPPEPCWQGCDTCETPFVVAALARWLEPARVLVIVTSQSRQRLDELRSAVREAMGDRREPPRIEEREVGSGQDRGSQDQLFHVMRECLEELRSFETVLDITHGYRCMPFLASSALWLQQAVARDVLPGRIVYGAADLQDGTGAVWDLSRFLVEMTTTGLVQQFMTTGDGRAAARYLEGLHRRLRGRHFRDGQGPEPPPDMLPFAGALRRFSADLATIRCGSLLLGTRRGPPSVTRLYERARAASEGGNPLAGAGSLDAVLRPLCELLEPLAEAVRRVRRTERPTLASPEGARAMAELALLYLRFNRFSEAIAVVREGWICEICQLASAPDAGRPGLDGYDQDAREQAEETVRRDRRFRALAGVRNDLLHAGFRKEPVPELAERVQKEVEAFREHLEKAPRQG